MESILTNILEHVLQCQNMRTFICDVCGKGFNLDSHLRKHKDVVYLDCQNFIPILGCSLEHQHKIT